MRLDCVLGVGATATLMDRCRERNGSVSTADRKRSFVTENGLVVIPKRAKLDDEKTWRL